MTETGKILYIGAPDPEQPYSPVLALGDSDFSYSRPQKRNLLLEPNSCSEE